VLPAHIYVMVKAAAEELAPTIHDLRRKGYSYREIAQTLGVSTKLVYNVLHSTSDTGGTGGMGDMGGNTPETLGNTPSRSGGWKHPGNSGKHLETFGNVSGVSGGVAVDTPTAVGSGGAPQVVKEEEGDVLWRERVEHLEREVAYLRGLVDRLTEAVQRQTEALAREQTIVHELQAKLEAPKTIPQPPPTTTPSGGETPKRRPWWRFW